MTNLKTIWSYSKKKLQDLPHADLDARLLIAFACQCPWQDIFSHPERNLTAEQITLLEQSLTRRLKGESVHRILGERDFYGHRFALSAETLEPRPDTETLIELISPCLPRNTPLTGLDIGTGSGILAITLACLFPQLHMTAIDISNDALQTAQKNAQTHHVAERIDFIQSNLFEKCVGKFDFIISNPPYIAQHQLKLLSATVRQFDPIAALDGGEDGLDFYKIFAENADQYLQKNAILALEIGFDQEQKVLDIFTKNQWTCLKKKKDLNQITRALLLQK